MLGAYGELCLRAVAAAGDAVARLGEGAGRRVVAAHAEAHRADDPETIAVDEAAEAAILEVIRQAGVNATVLSEEAGEVRVAGKGEPVFVVVDPFDGSALYRHGIRAFWYSAVGVLGPEGRPLAAACLDLIHGTVEVAGGGKGCKGRLEGTGVLDPDPLRPSAATRLQEARLEVYLMKPVFLRAALDRVGPLLRAAGFVLPNGGPPGLADVAAGRVDLYVGLRQGPTEIFSALALAEAAGATVTDLTGQPLRFVPDMSATSDVLCAATPPLHREALRALRAGGR
ncbi:MAG TPA: inositol monophosphatase family protein [Candidatus Methylomirabilis sp.]|nr:inositol monophosphatase family protein [Candidatus Methylomirabilis sp.]